MEKSISFSLITLAVTVLLFSCSSKSIDSSASPVVLFENESGHLQLFMDKDPSAILKSLPHQRRVIFNGNSHFNVGQNSITVLNDYYVPRAIYDSVRAMYPVTACIFAVSGNPTTKMNANFDVQNLPVIQKGDIVVLWEATNDIPVNKLTGEQAYTQLAIFAKKVHALGAYILVGTTTARNHKLDPTDIWERGQACNTLIRNSSGVFDGIIDVASDPQMDDQADCADTTIYIDGLHFAARGQAKIINYFSKAIKDFIALHPN